MDDGKVLDGYPKDGRFHASLHYRKAFDSSLDDGEVEICGSLEQNLESWNEMMDWDGLGPSQGEDAGDEDDAGEDEEGDDEEECMEEQECSSSYGHCLVEDDSESEEGVTDVKLRLKPKVEMGEPVDSVLRQMKNYHGGVVPNHLQDHPDYLQLDSCLPYILNSGMLDGEALVKRGRPQRARRGGRIQSAIRSGRRQTAVRGGGSGNRVRGGQQRSVAIRGGHQPAVVGDHYDKRAVTRGHKVTASRKQVSWRGREHAADMDLPDALGRSPIPAHSTPARNPLNAHLSSTPSQPYSWSHWTPQVSPIDLSKGAPCKDDWGLPGPWDLPGDIMIKMEPEDEVLDLSVGKPGGKPRNKVSSTDETSLLGCSELSDLACAVTKGKAKRGRPRKNAFTAAGSTRPTELPMSKRAGPTSSSVGGDAAQLSLNSSGSSPVHYSQDNNSHIQTVVPKQMKQTTKGGRKKKEIKHNITSDSGSLRILGSLNILSSPSVLNKGESVISTSDSVVVQPWEISSRGDPTDSAEISGCSLLSDNSVKANSGSESMNNSKLKKPKRIRKKSVDESNKTPAQGNIKSSKKIDVLLNCDTNDTVAMAAASSESTQDVLNMSMETQQAVNSVLDLCDRQNENIALSTSVPTAGILSALEPSHSDKKKKWKQTKSGGTGEKVCNKTGMNVKTIIGKARKKNAASSKKRTPDGKEKSSCQDSSSNAEGSAECVENRGKYQPKAVVRPVPDEATLQSGHKQDVPKEGDTSKEELPNPHKPLKAGTEEVSDSGRCTGAITKELASIFPALTANYMAVHCSANSEVMESDELKNAKLHKSQKDEKSRTAVYPMDAGNCSSDKIICGSICTMNSQHLYGSSVISHKVGTSDNKWKESELEKGDAHTTDFDDSCLNHSSRALHSSLPTCVLNLFNYSFAAKTQFVSSHETDKMLESHPCCQLKPYLSPHDRSCSSVEGNSHYVTARSLLVSSDSSPDLPPSNRKKVASQRVRNVGVQKKPKTTHKSSVAHTCLISSDSLSSDSSSDDDKPLNTFRSPVKVASTVVDLVPRNPARVTSTIVDLVSTSRHLSDSSKDGNVPTMKSKHYKSVDTSSEKHSSDDGKLKINQGMQENREPERKHSSGSHKSSQHRESQHQTDSKKNNSRGGTVIRESHSESRERSAPEKKHKHASNIKERRKSAEKRRNDRKHDKLSKDRKSNDKTNIKTTNTDSKKSLGRLVDDASSDHGAVDSTLQCKSSSKDHTASKGAQVCKEKHTRKEPEDKPGKMSNENSSFNLASCLFTAQTGKVPKTSMEKSQSRQKQVKPDVKVKPGSVQKDTEDLASLDDMSYVAKSSLSNYVIKKKAPGKERGRDMGLVSPLERVSVLNVTAKGMKNPAITKPVAAKPALNKPVPETPVNDSGKPKSLESTPSSSYLDKMQHFSLMSFEEDLQKSGCDLWSPPRVTSMPDDTDLFSGQEPPLYTGPAISNAAELDVDMAPRRNFVKLSDYMSLQAKGESVKFEQLPATSQVGSHMHTKPVSHLSGYVNAADPRLNRQRKCSSVMAVGHESRDEIPKLHLREGETVEPKNVGDSYDAGIKATEENDVDVDADRPWEQWSDHEDDGRNVVDSAETSLAWTYNSSGDEHMRTALEEPQMSTSGSEPCLAEQQDSNRPDTYYAEALLFSKAPHSSYMEEVNLYKPPNSPVNNEEAAAEFSDEDLDDSKSAMSACGFVTDDEFDEEEFPELGHISYETPENFYKASHDEYAPDSPIIEIIGSPYQIPSAESTPNSMRLIKRRSPRRIVQVKDIVEEAGRVWNRYSSDQTEEGVGADVSEPKLAVLHAMEDDGNENPGQEKETGAVKHSGDHIQEHMDDVLEHASGADLPRKVDVVTKETGSPIPVEVDNPNQSPRATSDPALESSLPKEYNPECSVNTKTGYMISSPADRHIHAEEGHQAVSAEIQHPDEGESQGNGPPIGHEYPQSSELGDSVEESFSIGSGSNTADVSADAGVEHAKKRQWQGDKKDGKEKRKRIRFNREPITRTTVENDVEAPGFRELQNKIQWLLSKCRRDLETSLETSESMDSDEVPTRFQEPCDVLVQNTERCTEHANSMEVVEGLADIEESPSDLQQGKDLVAEQNEVPISNAATGHLDSAAEPDAKNTGEHTPTPVQLEVELAVPEYLPEATSEQNIGDCLGTSDDETPEMTPVLSPVSEHGNGPLKVDAHYDEDETPDMTPIQSPSDSDTDEGVTSRITPLHDEEETPDTTTTLGEAVAGDLIPVHGDKTRDTMSSLGKEALSTAAALKENIGDISSSHDEEKAMDVVASCDIEDRSYIAANEAKSDKSPLNEESPDSSVLESVPTEQKAELVKKRRSLLQRVMVAEAVRVRSEMDAVKKPDDGTAPTGVPTEHINETTQCDQGMMDTAPEVGPTLQDTSVAESLADNLVADTSSAETSVAYSSASLDQSDGDSETSDACPDASTRNQWHDGDDVMDEDASSDDDALSIDAPSDASFLSDSDEESFRRSPVVKPKSKSRGLFPSPKSNSSSGAEKGGLTNEVLASKSREGPTSSTASNKPVSSGINKDSSSLQSEGGDDNGNSIKTVRDDSRLDVPRQELRPHTSGNEGSSDQHEAHSAAASHGGRRSGSDRFKGALPVHPIQPSVKQSQTADISNARWDPNNFLMKDISVNQHAALSLPLTEQKPSYRGDPPPHNLPLKPHDAMRRSTLNRIDSLIGEGAEVVLPSELRNAMQKSTINRVDSLIGEGAEVGLPSELRNAMQKSTINRVDSMVGEGAEMVISRPVGYGRLNPEMSQLPSLSSEQPKAVKREVIQEAPRLLGSGPVCQGSLEAYSTTKNSGKDLDTGEPINQSSLTKSYAYEVHKPPDTLSLGSRVSRQTSGSSSERARAKAAVESWMRRGSSESHSSQKQAAMGGRPQVPPNATFQYCERRAEVAGRNRDWLDLAMVYMHLVDRNSHLDSVHIKMMAKSLFTQDMKNLGPFIEHVADLVRMRGGEEIQAGDEAGLRGWDFRNIAHICLGLMLGAQRSKQWPVAFHILQVLQQNKFRLHSQAVSGLHSNCEILYDCVEVCIEVDRYPVAAALLMKADWLAPRRGQPREREIREKRLMLLRRLLKNSMEQMQKSGEKHHSLLLASQIFYNLMQTRADDDVIVSVEGRQLFVDFEDVYNRLHLAAMIQGETRISVFLYKCNCRSSLRVSLRKEVLLNLLGHLYRSRTQNPRWMRIAGMVAMDGTQIGVFPRQAPLTVGRGGKVLLHPRMTQEHMHCLIFGYLDKMRRMYEERAQRDVPIRMVEYDLVVEFQWHRGSPRAGPGLEEAKSKVERVLCRDLEPPLPPTTVGNRHLKLSTEKVKAFLAHHSEECHRLQRMGKSFTDGPVVSVSGEGIAAGKNMVPGSVGAKRRASQGSGGSHHTGSHSGSLVTSQRDGTTYSQPRPHSQSGSSMGDGRSKNRHGPYSNDTRPATKAARMCDDMPSVMGPPDSRSAVPSLFEIDTSSGLNGAAMMNRGRGSHLRGGTNIRGRGLHHGQNASNFTDPLLGMSTYEGQDQTRRVPPFNPSYCTPHSSQEGDWNQPYPPHHGPGQGHLYPQGHPRPGRGGRGFVHTRGAQHRQPQQQFKNRGYFDGDRNPYDQGSHPDGRNSNEQHRYPGEEVDRRFMDSDARREHNWERSGDGGRFHDNGRGRPYGRGGHNARSLPQQGQGGSHEAAHPHPAGFRGVPPNYYPESEYENYQNKYHGRGRRTGRNLPPLGRGHPYGGRGRINNPECGRGGQSEGGPGRFANMRPYPPREEPLGNEFPDRPSMDEPVRLNGDLYEDRDYMAPSQDIPWPPESRDVHTSRGHPYRARAGTGSERINNSGNEQSSRYLEQNLAADGCKRYDGRGRGRQRPHGIQQSGEGSFQARDVDVNMDIQPNRPPAVQRDSGSNSQAALTVDNLEAADLEQGDRRTVAPRGFDVRRVQLQQKNSPSYADISEWVNDVNEKAPPSMPGPHNVPNPFR